MWLIAFMSFGFTEILVIGTVALLVFGGELPDVMRNLGRAYGKFRQGLQDMSQPVREEFRRVKDDLPSPATTPSTTPNDTTPETSAPEPAPAPYEVGAPPEADALPPDIWDELDEPPPV